MSRDTLEREYRDWLGAERAEDDSLHAKKLYVHMAGDIVPGLLLSQIVYWHSNDKDGKTRLRVERDGHKWLVKKRDDWWNEICLKPRQVDRALQLLRDRGLVETIGRKVRGRPHHPHTTRLARVPARPPGVPRLLRRRPGSRHPSACPGVRTR